ncbi:MAG: aspartate/tyrosine/aromatic aminotransferase [Candidatus Latescibacteria bacterium]|nr:aspartate/tyrosine/aromatic aminotransferase [Candidatus Latescibacterota bacterium]
MFETLEVAPADPILGLTAAYNQDTNPDRINLGVGVYKDGDGNTPVFNSVQRAEARILDRQNTKDYLPISGAPEYAAAVQALLFGPEHEVVTGKRAATFHAPGGTGGLRVAGDFVHKLFPQARICLSEPTWANHPNIYKHAGVAVETYPYFRKETNDLDFAAMRDALNSVPEGDIVLLHGCCHNPTGIDPTPEQWAQIAEVAGARGWIPLVDFAYHGLGDGLEQDRRGLLAFCRTGAELMVSSSFSKNFGLYNERVGALTLVASSPEAAGALMSQVMICIRANYSNPPAHGAAIVTEVLNDSGLRQQWEGEVTEMRNRINSMRALFVDTLERKGVRRDFSFIARQRGMFSFSGLTGQQVDALREENAIYMVGSGRINVAGITEANIDYLCESIAAVLRPS